MDSKMYPLHVEIVQEPNSSSSKDEIIDWTNVFLQSLAVVNPGDTISKSQFNCDMLKDHVMSISFCDIRQHEMIDIKTADIQYHVYRLDQLGSYEDYLVGDDNNEELPAANFWQLPSKDFSGLWENLVYDSNVKEHLLNFVETSLLFSGKCINANVINWNGVVLLHGPPGTGKTSLCKALAQKLSIRLGNRYSSGQLVEINSHSLFSKWFSESGKLVLKLFKKIHELLDNPDVLVCVLIDEIESLAHARQAAFAGSEPSDSIRVVNAILTQIDRIRQFPNVIILTTSNMTEAIDLAFVDRADIKQYIGLPSTKAIYQIYLSCIVELISKGIIESTKLFPYKILESIKFEPNDWTKMSFAILDLAKYSQGLSGRNLRKIPFLAHALFIQSDCVNLETFLMAMKEAVKKELADSEVFRKSMGDIKIK